MSASFSKQRRACASMPAGIALETGSAAVRPDEKTKPPNAVAGEYARGADRRTAGITTSRTGPAEGSGMNVPSRSAGRALPRAGVQIAACGTRSLRLVSDRRVGVAVGGRAPASGPPSGKLAVVDSHLQPLDGPPPDVLQVLGDQAGGS